MTLVKKLFPPERKAARLDAQLQKALETRNQPKASTAFCHLLLLQLQEERAQPLSNLILSSASQIEDTSFLVNNISADDLRRAIRLLANNDLVPAAVQLCSYSKNHRDAVEILARRGRAEELASYLTKDNLIDRELLETVVNAWEAHNGDIRVNPTMRAVLVNIAAFAPASMPNNPRVKDIIGRCQEAGVLYEAEGSLRDAAACYEKAELYDQARDLYDRLGDRERASKAAESAGDLETALQFALNPERKFDLLVRTGRFQDALGFAAGLESPDEHVWQVKKAAEEAIGRKVQGLDFIGALECAEIAGCEPAMRESILSLGRRYLERKIADATSEDGLKSLYRERIKLEEKAGNYETAAQLAEETLEDFGLASLLWEKASLFNRALAAVSETPEGQARETAAQLRLAELHERGGNLAKAARLYEAAGQYDKAHALYEGMGRFDKAIECYLRTSLPRREVLIGLYIGAGEVEKVIELYLDAGGFADLEQALAVATVHNLTSHIRIIKERMAGLATGSEKDWERCFAAAQNETIETYPPVIGIDFGTTNSVVAIFNKKSRKTEIVLTARGSEQEPSFYGVDEHNHPIFGEDARLRSLTSPECVVARAKRGLGAPERFTIKGKKYRCEEIVASFLQHLRSNAEAYVQAKVEARFRELLEREGLTVPDATLRGFLSKQEGKLHIEDVVLSVPAYFDDNQKRATRDAAELAGLNVRRLLHEPTAAALAFSHQKPYAGKLAVIDLGGGTLDISIVDIGEGVNDVQVIGGDTKLGGSDIDALLVERVLTDIQERWGVTITEVPHPAEIARLRDACENLKINLSSSSQYSLELVHFLNRPKYDFSLTRAELERLAEPVLARIKGTIETTLKDYNSKIDNFLLVGNATKMPIIGELARKSFHAPQLGGIDPGIVVATGAALEGAILNQDLQQILVLDVVPYSLGFAVVKPDSKTDEEEVQRLIERNSTIPITKSTVCTTKVDNQPNVEIKVFQGEASELRQNHFLGRFWLDGIQPAPAHKPQIEVTFDIGADCILTVKAMDKGTGCQNSIRIEGAVALSPQEKETLRGYFARMEEARSAEEELTKISQEIADQESACETSLRTAERAARTFSERFHERVEINGQFYGATSEQATAIRAMFVQRDQLDYDIRRYRDQFNSALSTLKQAQAKHLDFSSSDIVSKLRGRSVTLAGISEVLLSIVASIGRDVTAIAEDWIQILDSLEPNLTKMTPLERTDYEMGRGRADKAREILESLAASEEGLTEGAFQRLLRCYVQLGLREEHRDAHQRFGRLFQWVYPDRLDTYIKAVADSVFMILTASGQHRGRSGSGFCITPNLIATNRHVVEGATRQEIRIIGKNGAYGVDHVEVEPLNDLAILRVGQSLKPFRLGEFGFLEPGEQVVAIGFPAPNSDQPKENIYVSRGSVNSIRATPISPERVIFMDAKIRPGMSGGPLINDLGEVIGIITLLLTHEGQSRTPAYVDTQPVALPIHLVRKYTMRG